MRRPEGNLFEVVSGLRRIGEALQQEDMPVACPQGRLIRPSLAYAVQRAHGWEADEPFWRAVAAIQYAHEASLVHDDILDNAEERRGERSYVGERGVRAALVRGDHLLTTAYRLAALTGSLGFAQLFARSVERTVAGESRQARCRGDWLSESEYVEIVSAKSGELLGCALAAGAAVREDDLAGMLFELGRRFGVCYQMLDDLLDYCPGSGSGKPALQDYRNRLWTWPLAESGISGFDLTPEEIVRRVHASGPGGEPGSVRRCLVRLNAELDRLERDVDSEPGLMGAFRQQLAEWRTIAARAVEGAERRNEQDARTSASVSAPAPATPARSLVAGAGSQGSSFDVLPDETSWNASLKRHARSFSFASLWFPRSERRRVADVYAFCRFTDDLIDNAEGSTPEELEHRLDQWLALSRASWEGRESSLPFLDRVMRDAAGSGAPFRVVEDLVEGMRMDIRVGRYPSMAELLVYTHRVAGVVGVWLTHLFGVHRPWVLERASLLGHAMQITNILRDVGEDLERGRVYLPQDLLAGHGLTEDDLRAMQRSGVILPEYRRLVERMMRLADDAYARALEALPELPAFFRRPVAVAARVYRGIHREIRRNDYDNLRLRAHTSGPRKTVLALHALVRPRIRMAFPVSVGNVEHNTIVSDGRQRVSA